MAVLARFIINLFLAVDQLLNTILLGHPDETLSSRLGRTIGCERWFWVGWFRWLVDTLWFWDTEIRDGKKIKHCEKSIMPLEQMNFRSFNYEILSWCK